MEKVRPWCGQPSDRGRLKNRIDQEYRIDLKLKAIDTTVPWPLSTTFICLFMLHDIFSYVVRHGEILTEQTLNY